MLRVLHIIRGLANSSGTTHIVNPLSEAQARLGGTVRVLYVDKPPAKAVEPDSSLVECRRFSRSMPLDNPGFSWGLAKALSVEVATTDVVHVHAIWNFPSWWSMRESARQRTPFIVAPQGSLDPWALRQKRSAKRIYGALTEMPLLRRANSMQALSDKEAAQFRDVGIEGRIDRIPNGIAADMFAHGPRRGALAQQLDLPDGARCLLFLSRVHQKKGLDLLLQAFAKLTSQFPNWHLVIAGNDGGSGYYAKMQQLRSQLGLDGRCHFLGEVAGQTKRDVLMGADAFALVSRSEGLPVAAVEALGAGLPCVLSDECNLPEAEAAGACWTVKPAIEAATSALRDLFANPEKAAARGERAKRLVADRFTWDKIAEQTLEIYSELISCQSAS